MRHIKIYENYKPKIQEGDYIVINIKTTSYQFDEFINNNIGQLIYIVPYNTDSYYIRYENIPKIINRWFHGKDKLLPSDPDLENSKCFNIHAINIIDYAKDKSELEYIFDSKNYNL